MCDGVKVEANDKYYFDDKYRRREFVCPKYTGNYFDTRYVDSKHMIRLLIVKKMCWKLKRKCLSSSQTI